MAACHTAWTSLAARSRLQSEGFRVRVARVLAAWADWAVYPDDFLNHLNSIFLGNAKVYLRFRVDIDTIRSDHTQNFYSNTLKVKKQYYF